MVNKTLTNRLNAIEVKLQPAEPIRVHMATECDTATEIEYIGQQGFYTWRVPYDLMDSFSDEVGKLFPDGKNIVITVIPPVAGTKARITRGK